MVSLRKQIWTVASIIFTAFMIAQCSNAQENADKSAVLTVPHTTVHIPFSCNGDIWPIWEKVPQTIVSHDSSELVRFDTNSLVNIVPDSIKSQLNSLRAEYRFQWDEKRLYGYVDINGAASESQQSEASKDHSCPN